MREIKFRAWDKELKVFSEIPLSYKIKDLNYYTDYVWMQYTGLKDKNGKEIYEGDIIKREFEISKEIYDPTTLGFVELEITNEGYFIGVVNFRPSEGWILNKCTKYNVEGEFMKKRSGVKIYKNHSEVIGNIYENPELLKGELK